MKFWSGKFFIIAVTVITIGVVYLNQSLVSSHYMLGFVYLAIPFLLLLNVLLLVWLGFKKNKLALLSLITLLCSYRQIRQNFNISFPEKAEASKTLKITTYNASSFYFYLPKKKQVMKPSECLNWITSNLNSDILCIQEFYNDPKKLSENAVDTLKAKGYKYMKGNPKRVLRRNYLAGVVTLSKYPIINSGAVRIGKEELPRSLFTDIVVKKDTIRVINVHLKSMAIRIYSQTSLEHPSTVYENARLIARKLKKGFSQRNVDIQLLGQFIRESPYKVILCGDFNDTPYSYSYQYIRKDLENAYEEAGTGFSFTFSGFPYFIRIDNQFYDEAFKAVYYKKLENNNASEHYPVECWYQLEKK